MPTMSLRYSKEDDKLFRDYAKLKGISINEMFKQAMFDKIESEVDLQMYEIALKEFEENPIVYSHDDVKAELGF